MHSPGESGEPNVYSYVSGKSLQNVDPLGLCAENTSCGENEFTQVYTDTVTPGAKSSAEPNSAAPARAQPPVPPKSSESTDDAPSVMTAFISGLEQAMSSVGHGSQAETAVTLEAFGVEGAYAEARADEERSSTRIAEQCGSSCAVYPGAASAGVEVGVLLVAAVGGMAIVRKSRGNRVPDRVQGRLNPEQRALVDMAEVDSKRIPSKQGPVSAGDADAYVELANEVKVPVRAKAADLSGSHGYGPVKPGPDASHIHINGKHVPVPPGYQPPPDAEIIK